MKKYFSTLLLSIPLIILSQNTVDNVILITLDGLRWQEVFGGAVDSMIENESLREILMKLKRDFKVKINFKQDIS